MVCHRLLRLGNHTQLKHGEVTRHTGKNDSWWADAHVIDNQGTGGTMTAECGGVSPTCRGLACGLCEFAVVRSLQTVATFSRGVRTSLPDGDRRHGC